MVDDFGGAERFITRQARGWIVHAAATGVARSDTLSRCSDSLSRGTRTAAGSYRQAFDPATYPRAARDAQGTTEDSKCPCARSLCQAQGVVLVVTSAAALPLPSSISSTRVLGYSS